jgi:hypothetical protein
VRVKVRLQILWVYLRTGLVDGPGAAYALWRRSRVREQRFHALYGRMFTSEEARLVTDKQLWYLQVLHRDPSEKELDQIIRDVMTWLHPSAGRDMVSGDRHED